jgi:hypothetical protein
MTMTIKRAAAILTLGALAVAASIGILAYRTVQAQTSTPSVPSSTAPAVLGHRGGPGGGFSNEDLANALGITVDELNTAYQTANEAAVQQAVDAGLITQAQADELLSRGTAFPFGGRWSGWLSQNGIDYQALLADALGISVDELQAAYAEAFTTRIDQAVADGQLTQEQADLMKGRYALANSESFQSAMQSAHEAAVNQAVADGVITQAQADLILQNSRDFGLRGFGEPFGPGFGRGGHHGGPGRGEGSGFGFGPGLDPGTSPDSPTTPDTAPTTPGTGL